MADPPFVVVARWSLIFTFIFHLSLCVRFADVLGHTEFNGSLRPSTGASPSLRNGGGILRLLTCAPDVLTL